MSLVGQPLDTNPTVTGSLNGAAAYAELRHVVTAAGLVERAYGYYLVRTLVTYGLLVGAIALPFWLPPTLGWWGVASGALAFALVQVGLIGHDAGHLAVFRSVRANRAFGQLCWSVSLAISFFYWNDRHTRHHAWTNDPEVDPDLGGFGVVAYSEDQAAAQRGWRRLLVRYQDVLAVLLLLTLAFWFRVEGWLFALRRLRGTRRTVEIGLLVLGTFLWLTPALVLGWSWVVVYLGSQVLASMYMSFVIAPNHYGMPLWSRGAPLSYLERQVLCSRNITANPLWDFVFGGLNHQIEHHLFPTMPRAHLGRARALVKPFCEARGIPCREANPFRAFLQVFADGHRVAQAARPS